MRSIVIANAEAVLDAFQDVFSKICIWMGSKDCRPRRKMKGGLSPNLESWLRFGNL